MATATTRTRKKVDPFAETETTEETDTKETSVTDDVTVDVAPTGEITLTFKAGSGYDVPWIVIRVPDLAAAEDVLTNQGEILKSVMEKTVRAGVYFVSQMPSTAPKASAETQSIGGGGAGRGAAPGGQARQCKHGDMVYRSGSKDGRTWEAFFCPTPKGTSDQCKAQFI